MLVQIKIVSCICKGTLKRSTLKQIIMKADKVVLGILGGVAVGALLGVLFAPEKGSKTRKKIADKGAGYAEDLKSQIDALIGTIQKKYDSATEEGKDAIIEGTEALTQAAKKL